MSYTLSLLRIAVLSLCLTIVVGAQTDWEGSYYFGENGGKTAGGTTIMISHELNVLDGGEGLAATIESNGYQTSAELVCSAKIEGSKLLIFFQSYGETNMFEPYSEGDLLFTLERRTAKGKTVILTHWGKFTPSIPKNERSGKVYFEKTAASQPK
ncbi:MAG: hypothetical protein H0U23_11730 [Blastocatellia bacterium]|nr:hypothetical protein [Blastocatellia bacterium]